ncbi:MAG: endonuclease/exonuclease/phosphatase family protein [Alistipes sp.]|nr:endonuclease/exonuclease/phosphatase family protein [Alistipes sp.]
MARQEQYIGRYSKDGTRRRSSLLGTALYVGFMLLSAALVIALIIAYISPHTSPSSLGSLTIVGIFAPMIYITVVLCMLLWVVLQRWIFAGVMLVALLPGISDIPKYYKIAFTREVEQTISKKSFKLMSYNVRGLRDDNGDKFLDKLVEWFNTEGVPDILCLQELPSKTEGIEMLDTLFSHSFKVYYSYDTTESDDIILRTYSRYPIIKRSCGSISGEGRGTSQWVDIVINSSNINSDTIRIFNNHLYTMNISNEDSDHIESGTIFNDSNRIRSIVNRIADNSSIRSQHVDTLCTIIGSTPYRHIVCGDFNDTPMSYTYNTLCEELNDAFVVKGRGYGYTFRPMHSMLRIDYILYSKGFNLESYKAYEDITYSDHLPIATHMTIKR